MVGQDSEPDGALEAQEPGEPVRRSYRLLAMLSLAAVGAVVLVPYAGLTNFGETDLLRTEAGADPDPVDQPSAGSVEEADESADAVASDEIEAADGPPEAYVRQPATPGATTTDLARAAVHPTGLLPPDPDALAHHRGPGAATAVGVVAANDRCRIHRHRRRLRRHHVGGGPGRVLPGPDGPGPGPRLPARVPARRRPLPLAVPGHVRRPARHRRRAGRGGVRPQHRAGADGPVLHAAITAARRRHRRRSSPVPASSRSPAGSGRSAASSPAIGCPCSGPR